MVEIVKNLGGRERFVQELTIRYSEIRTHLISYARKLSQGKMDSDAAEDLVSMTLEKALKHADKFDGRSIINWLYTIQRNVFLSEIRRPYRRNEMREDPQDFNRRGEVIEETYTSSFAVIAKTLAEGSIEAAESVEAFTGFFLKRIPVAMAKALRNTSATRLNALLLFEILGLSYKEISKLMGIQVKSVGTNIFKAKERLSQLRLLQDIARDFKILRRPDQK